MNISTMDKYSSKDVGVLYSQAIALSIAFLFLTSLYPGEGSATPLVRGAVERPTASTAPGPKHNAVSAESADKTPDSTSRQGNNISEASGTGNAILKSERLSSCAYTFSPSGKAFSSGGGKIAITVQASDADCPAPEISPDRDWISASFTASSTRGGFVEVSVSENNGSTDNREGAVVIGDGTFSVRQKGIFCSMTITPAISQLVPKSGGETSFTVTTVPDDCHWTAMVDKKAPWVTVTSDPSGTGGGSFTCTVEANPAKNARTGKVYVVLTSGKKTKTVTIRQWNK